jgi:error-prone DNA polymerase
MDYVELHCHSYFSLLDGASSPEQLVKQAAALGYRALALTDHDGLYGAVRFWHAAREQQIKPIIGAELTLADGHHLILLAETQRGYANLCRLISMGQLAGQKRQPQLTLNSVAERADGLLCLSGCRQGAIASALLDKDRKAAHAAACALREIFGHSLWIELQHHYVPIDAQLNAELVDLARQLNTGYVATNNVHYAERSGQRLHDVLTCIHHRTTLPEALASGLLHPNSELFLKPPQDMVALFNDLPEAIDNTRQIAARCQAMGLDFSRQQLPSFPIPPGHTPLSYLQTLCEEGLPRKFDPITAQARAQLAHELSVIEHTGLAGYFLVVWDIVRFARSEGIRCQGRGSAANSLVAYLLDITPVDPLRYHLLFERFLSEGTHTMPDIDVDFAADRREEVIQYVYQRYGEEHVAMVCNAVTFRARSAVRDVAKVLTFPPDVIDRTAKALDTHSPTEAATQMLADSTLEPGTEDDQGAALPWQVLADLLREIDGVPRHLSIHVGGMLITAAPLVEIVPVERATMPGRVVVQWDKDSVEDAGLIKIDLLSLRTLDAVEEALQHIREQRGIELDLERLPMDDPAVYDILQRADTIGSFQVESRAQAQMLPRLKPVCFEDIVVEVALVRPGPIQGNMVHPYLRRRQGLEEVTYAHPALEPVLAETLGVILFQEQVIRVAVVIAGFSPAEADQLRRAMSRSRSEQAMAAIRERFMAGALANGVTVEAAADIFQQLAGFAEFGFCKSHAAAFALVAYQTLYLKVHFPAEFYCGLLNHQPMGFYIPEVVIGDAQRHGVPVRRSDINRSQSACTLERSSCYPEPPLERAGKGSRLQRHEILRFAQNDNRRALRPAQNDNRRALRPAQNDNRGALRPAQNDLSERFPSLAIRLGLRYVHGLGEATIERIVDRRGERPYRDLRDFCRRTHLPRALVENLIRAGAMDSFDEKRRDLLWALGGLEYQEDGLDIVVPLDEVALPTLRAHERLSWEYELLGLAPGEHIMQLYRERLRRQGVLSKAELEERQDGETVRVAGWMVIRQRPPTAKGHIFITLEDEEGLINLIVRPQVYERYKEVLRNSPLLWVEGLLQREGHAISVLVRWAGSLMPAGKSDTHVVPARRQGPGHR